MEPGITDTKGKQREPKSRSLNFFLLGMGAGLLSVWPVVNWGGITDPFFFALVALVPIFMSGRTP